MGQEAILNFEILESLKNQGYSDYPAFMVSFIELKSIDPEADLENSGIVGSWSTNRPSGFSNNDIQAIQRIEQRLAVAFKMNIQNQITKNILLPSNPLEVFAKAESNSILWFLFDLYSIWITMKP